MTARFLSHRPLTAPADIGQCGNSLGPLTC